MSFEQTAQLLAQELEQIQKSSPAGFTFTVSGAEAFVLVGLLQLAWRHPNLNPKQRELLERVVDGLAQPLTGPTLRETIRQGWDRTRDR